MKSSLEETPGTKLLKAALEVLGDEGITVTATLENDVAKSVKKREKCGYKVLALKSKTPFNHSTLILSKQPHRTDRKSS